MTNLEYIRRLPPEELAKLLVREEEVNTGDEDYTGEWVDFWESFYVPPDGSGQYIVEADAVEYTVGWLQREHKNEE